MKRTPSPNVRFRAISMELAVHLDDRRVDMVVITEDGTTVSIECQGNTILDVQRHIGLVTVQCPEIARWT